MSKVTVDVTQQGTQLTVDEHSGKKEINFMSHVIQVTKCVHKRLNKGLDISQIEL